MSNKKRGPDEHKTTPIFLDVPNTSLPSICVYHYDHFWIVLNMFDTPSAIYRTLHDKQY